MNSFLQLEAEDIQQFVVERQDTVRETVHDRVSTHQFIGDVVELFFPRMADTMTVLLGGDVAEPDPNYFTLSEDEPEDTNQDRLPPAGPTGQDEIIR
ncbi:MAG: hypothetical protein AAFN92_09865 [Bacteroidota bacterium]